MKMSDLNIASEEAVVTPRAVHDKFKLSKKAQAFVIQARKEFVHILRDHSRKFVIMVGPCSIHDYDLALDYAKRLASLSEQVADRILIVMRIYFEKPRTIKGWKGLFTDPHLDGSDDLNHGLMMARKIMRDVSELGLPIVTEFLDPRVPRFISDLVTTGTIGARTTESQTHREMASGLTPAIGFKNSTDGTVRIAIDAAESAQFPHKFLGINMNGVQMQYRTTGNPHGYIILRGGNRQTNFQVSSINKVVKEMEARGSSFRIAVDCSHGNSKKNHELQRVAFESVLKQVLKGNSPIMGVMLESNLFPGNQKFDPGVTSIESLKYGVSITDACIGWEETQSLILDAYNRLGKRK